MNPHPAPCQEDAVKAVTPSIADILDRAADLIEPEGAWGQVGGVVGNHCADTAICEVRRRARLRIDAADAARDLLAEQIGWKGGGEDAIQSWNDQRGRTQPEVVATLREAAAVARERGL